MHPRYEVDDLGHTGKAVSYCKRRLAEKEKAKRETKEKAASP